MKIFVFFQTAIKSIWSLKLRSFLTILGILIGVFAIVSLVSLGEGVKKEIIGQIEGIGTDILGVIPGKLEGRMSSPVSIAALPCLTFKDKQTLKEELKDEVIEVAGAMFLNVVIEKDKKIFDATLVGADTGLQEVNVYKLEKGRVFTDKENQAQKQVILLGAELAKEIFKEEEALAKNIKINNLNFEIIGIVKSTSLSQLGANVDVLAVIPLNTALKIQSSTNLQRIMIKVKEGVDIEKLKERIREVLFDLHKKEDFSVVALEDVALMFDQVMSILTALVSALAGISLLVAGVGIMNIMLVSVAERTREIGLRKALGARPKDIMIQFLIEAMVLTFLGGALGIIFSLITLFIIDLNTPLNFSFSFKPIAIGIGVSGLVGLVFGLFPAWQAAKKDPIEALRYE